MEKFTRHISGSSKQENFGAGKDLEIPHRPSLHLDPACIMKDWCMVHVVSLYIE
nr:MULTISPECIES: hypothetical protein [Porphyromonas]